MGLKRNSPYPRTLAEAEFVRREAQQRFAPLVANLHDLDLLGLTDAVVAEMKTRRPEGEKSARRIANAIVGIGNR